MPALIVLIVILGLVAILGRVLVTIVSGTTTFALTTGRNAIAKSNANKQRQRALTEARARKAARLRERARIARENHADINHYIVKGPTPDRPSFYAAVDRLTEAFNTLDAAENGDLTTYEGIYDFEQAVNIAESISREVLTDLLDACSEPHQETA